MSIFMQLYQVKIRSWSVREKAKEKFYLELFYIKCILYSHGAEEVGEPEAKRPAGTKNAFRGAGYRLGETEEDPIDVVQGAPIRDQSRKVEQKN